MKLLVIGGTGLIGSKLTSLLRDRGHDVIAASPRTGVDAVTGHGLDGAMAGVEVVVDVANSPSFEDGPALTFFESAGRNLAAAETRAGVKHHVALSVVGTDRLLESGYFRAKMAQEKLIMTSRVPFSIVRATQFFEFIGAVAQSGIQGQTVRLPSALMQPIAAHDVAAALLDVALAKPANGLIELGGPEALPIHEFARRLLSAAADPRQVIADDQASYFGVKLSRRSLVPEDDARRGPTHFADWLRTAALAPAMVG